MATIIPKQSFINNVTAYEPSDLIGDITFIAGKSERLKILSDRESRGFKKVQRRNPLGGYEFEDTHSVSGEKDVQLDIIDSRQGGTQDVSKEAYSSELRGNRKSETLVKNFISIVDIDFNSIEDASTRHYSYIKLPFIPPKLSYNPLSQVIGIPSFGRNNPYYQYSGSEDTLNFTIDWFSEKDNRQDVIFKCRWLEALTKGDSYGDTLHRIKLIWGDEDLLFSDDLWIIDSAPYDLSNFVNAYRENDEIVKVGLLPQQAYQKVRLKKITSNNLSASEIIGKLGTP